jgi:alkylhydroperoxidase/carboxymuconolactone decarboxylase family protein YurZ
MTRQDILNDITKTLGSVPGWLARLEGEQLENTWAQQSWFMKDTKLSARDKALVAFGAASAGHCVY